MVNHYNALSGATLCGGNEMEKEEHKSSGGVLISRKSANTSHVVAESGEERGNGRRKLHGYLPGLLLQGKAGE